MIFQFDDRTVPDVRTALPIDESSEWSDEDMRDFAIASLRDFEAAHPDEYWGTDYTTPESK
jgi:hypothetical protein